MTCKCGHGLDLHPQISCTFQKCSCSVFREFHLGMYKHWKHGTLYQVLGVVTDTETLTPLVRYKRSDDTGPEWARPISMFLELVPGSGGLRGVPGSDVPRFAYVPPLIERLIAHLEVEHSDEFHQEWRTAHPCKTCSILEDLKKS